jgi:hypothetical protein
MLPKAKLAFQNILYFGKEAIILNRRLLVSLLF